MDVLKAARESLELGRSIGLDKFELNGELVPSSLKWPHLESMLTRMSEHEGTPHAFSERKRGSWLGWMQASLCALSVWQYEFHASLGLPVLPRVLDVDAFKEINMQNSDNPNPVDHGAITS